MLAIFDIDGTICDTQEVEGRCYARAIHEVLGVSLATLDWTQYPEPTSSGIVRGLMEPGDPDAAAKEEAIKSKFVRYLREAQPEFPGDFTPLPGAVEFLQRLASDPGWSIALATGAFYQEARFKLECCGLDLDAYPHATSCDTPLRREIIPLAAARAGGHLEEAVYLGDALWDFHVSRALGVPMIGIGRRNEQLCELGLDTVFRDFTDSESILSAIEGVRALKNV